VGDEEKGGGSYEGEVKTVRVDLGVSVRFLYFPSLGVGSE
jgi:hypothetical protein